MSNGAYGENIARLDERDKAIIKRLDRIEDKVDQLTWKVAGFSGTVALVTSLVVVLVAAPRSEPAEDPVRPARLQTEQVVE